MKTPNVTDVVVPLGGGGLGAGVALAIKTFKPEVRVIGAIPEGSPAWKDSLAAGRVSPADHVVTSAEGVAVKHPGDLPFALINEALGRPGHRHRARHQRNDSAHAREA